LMNANLIKAGIMSSLSFPLKYQGTILGAINLGSKKVNNFSERHLSLLTQIAPQLAISIENSRLYLLIKQEKASLEEEVKKRTEELLQSRRLAALGELASSMAHEVRHPLLRIRLLVDQLKRAISEESESEPWMDSMNPPIEGIIHEINQINTLVTDILDYSKPIKLNIIPLEIESIIESALSSIEEEAHAKGIKINWELARTEPGKPMLEVNVDGNRIKQVLVNLFKNALDAMETGGQLLLRTSPLPDRVEVYIQDTGYGMSAEVLKRIFEPFYTTKEKGIGLGMAIAKRIIELHQGEILVESTEGIGTAVRLRLPYGKAG